MTLHTTGVREMQRRRTRRALLDAALSELEERSLGSLGLREVTRAAGVSPTAFYRHFRGMDELGTALVEEALASLHVTVRGMLAATGDAERRGDAAVRLVAALVRSRPGHVRFLVRERHGGVPAVREAIAPNSTPSLTRSVPSCVRIPAAPAGLPTTCGCWPGCWSTTCS